MEINGQIKPASLAGEEIKKIVKRTDIQTIVESGTWEGGGSTLCVLNSLRDDQIFYTIELYPDVFEKAKNNLKEYTHKDNFKMLNGAIINFEDIFYFDHIKEIDFVNDVHEQLWYDKDLRNLKNSKNISEFLSETIDFLILDGGEWSTYPEWEKLKDRTKIVFLDDTGSFKTKQIRAEIISSNKYTTIIDKTDMHGFRSFAIFEKIR